MLTVTLNRPEKFNAFDATLHAELAHCLTQLPSDHAARILILTGAGKAFSAGGDMTTAPPGPGQFARDAQEGRAIARGLLDCPQMVICRMNGDAIGLGATIALLSDFVIAADTARIGDPHVRMGLVAGDGGALIWPMLVGPMLAKRYLLTGDLVAAPRAAELGLITQSVPIDSLDAEVSKQRDKLLAGAPLAQQFTKRSVNAALQALMATQFDLSLAYEGITILSADHVEARAAFVAKRAPNFTGD